MLSSYISDVEFSHSCSRNTMNCFLYPKNLTLGKQKNDMQLTKKVINLKIPEKPAIYGLYLNSELVYVGSTNNLRTRIGQHLHKNGKHPEPFDAYSYEIVDGDYDNTSMVAMYILMHKPAWNKQVPFNPKWKSIEAIHKKHCALPLKELKELLYQNKIEPAYTFRSIAYYDVDPILELLPLF